MRFNFYQLSIFILTFFLFSAFTNSNELKPTVKVVRKKITSCNGKGSAFESLFVSSQIKDENIEILFFAQKYDLKWMKKVYNLEGAGIINTNLQSCLFTGNYFVLGYYKSDNDMHDINLTKVPILHSTRGDKPKFRVTRRKKIDQEKGGGVLFETGEVFTPRGEAVEITLFLQKNDGSWRKKHYNYIGSGNLEINECGKELNGRYKSLVTITADFTEKLKAPILPTKLK
ncbi:MAG: hypothetical protein AAGI07_12010 [Bacteroidota bacterium]